MTPDRFVTATRFAEITGVSLAAISKAVAAGHVVRGEDRFFDLMHPKNMAYLHKDTKKRDAARRRLSVADQAVLQDRRVREMLEKKGLLAKKQPEDAPPPATPPAPVAPAEPKKRGRPRKNPLPVLPEPQPVVDPPTVAQKPKPKRQVDTPFDGIDMSNIDLSTLDKVDVDKLKVIEAIDSARLKNDQLRRTLIDRKLVAIVLGKIHTVDVQEFLAIPIRVAPLIAGDFGRDDEATLHAIEKRLSDELYKCLGHVKRIIDDFLEEIENEGGEVEIDRDEPEA